MPSLALSPVVPLASPRRLEFRHAYAAVLPEMLRLKAEELLPINRDVSGVVTTVLGAAVRLRGFRARMRALPEFDWGRVERLEVYARALAQAQALYATSGETSGELPELVREVRELRGMLLSDARALARRGFMNIQKLKAPRGQPSHRDLAFGLLTLAGLLRRQFGVIQRRSAITLADLDRAEGVAEKLLGAVARRGRAPSRTEEAREMLRRAFTLCVGAYAEARRGLVFLCGSRADADCIAPSLFVRKARRRRPAS